MNFYVLNSEHQVIDVSDDVRRWSEFFEVLDNRRVNHTEVTDKVTVSTVFIGIDHRFDNKGPPLLFETMIFGGHFDQETWRYSSWDDAEIGHQMAVKKVREGE